MIDLPYFQPKGSSLESTLFILKESKLLLLPVKGTNKFLSYLQSRYPVDPVKVKVRGRMTVDYLVIDVNKKEREGQYNFLHKRSQVRIGMLDVVLMQAVRSRLWVSLVKRRVQLKSQSQTELKILQRWKTESRKEKPEKDDKVSTKRWKT